jgi:hypothetical protein
VLQDRVCHVSVFGNTCDVQKFASSAWAATGPAGTTLALTPGALPSGNGMVYMPYWWSDTTLHIDRQYDDRLANDHRIKLQLRVTCRAAA